MMKLWYHEDSDSLYWSEEWDGMSTEVTSDKRFLRRAKELRIHRPAENATLFERMSANTVKANTMAAAIVKSYKAWERKPADLYPTPVDATESIMPLIKALGIKTVWEPACGDGRLARVLEWHGIEVHASDIRNYPGFGYGGLDFLNDDPIEKWGWEVGEIDAVITNPPFSLAKEFIEKGLEYAPIVIMLVKQNYYNTKGRLPFFEGRRPTFFLPITWRLAFLKEERGNSPLMDCAWAVWTREKDLFDAEGRAIDACLFEPVRKLVYPGYHQKGLKASLANLTEAFDELADSLSRRNEYGLVRSRDMASEVTSDDHDDI